MKIFLVIAGLNLFLSGARVFVFLYHGVEASRFLYDGLMAQVMNAPSLLFLFLTGVCRTDFEFVYSSLV